ncbi:hypothetical protein [Streptomyces macrosporus]|uniref:Uncharacterized protein n=1 Tax=Streptomyces macrosporus TaxID=44032 RepID=A0ABN3KDW0_9ACTN
MSGTRCKRCDLLIGMGCACSSRKNGGQGEKRSGSGGKRRQEQPVTVRRIAKTTTRRNGGRPFPASAVWSDALAYDDDREAEASREELRDITERGTSVRTVSGGLPTLGRRR